MPKILARDPAWLARSTPGFNLFQPDTSTSKAQRSQEVSHDGPIRKIAHRGTEVFVAVGNELRWSELGLLRDAGEDYTRKHAGRYSHDAEQAEGERVYRVLKTPVSRPITQLTISPSGHYLAILTTHTIHISILPSSSHLRPQDPTPLRLKSFQIGPTAHVLEQAPLVSALWHPLAPSGDCLITVTHDACVRLWELDSENRSSFDEPALAVDLKKLANATSAQSEFGASKYGTNKGFSPDDVEMQVAAACFGGLGREDEHGWASMTLWVAMTEGDVYALCPFLPSKWRAPATLLPSLSTSVLEKAKAISQDADVSEGERRTVEQQYKWLADTDAQEPLLLPGQSEFDTVEVYTRPTRLGAVPKLQGPFQISPQPDFGEITDIFALAPKIDDEALYSNDENNIGETSTPVDEEGLSVGMVCLATSTNEIHVCLSIDGVEAEWLPSKRPRAYTFDNDDDDLKELVLFETIDLASREDEDDGCPAFTPSPQSRYEFFVTHPTGVCGLSFLPWVSALENEFASPSDNGVGTGFRLNVLLDSAGTVVDQLVEIPKEHEERGVNAALAILDPGMGFTVLTEAMNTPYAAILDASTSPTHPYAPDQAQPAALLPAPEPRAPYRPAQAFSNPSTLPHLIKSSHENRTLGTSDPKSQIRFSPATLQLLTEAHRIMATETHRLGTAAAELFRRCERMRAELREQVRRVAEVAQRVDSVTGMDEDDDGEVDGGEEGEGEGDGEGEGRLAGRDKIDHRIERSQAKTAELNERVEALRRKMASLGGVGGAAGAGGAKLSAKEAAFAHEVAKLEGSILSVDAAGGEPMSADESPPPRQRNGGPLSKRLEAVRSLQRGLVEEANRVGDEASSSRGGAETKDGARELSRGGAGVGGEFRRQKLKQVMGLLERETALVEGVMERLRRLQGDVGSG